MKKTIQMIVLAMLCLEFTAEAQQPPINQQPQKTIHIQGKVVSDSSGEALPGAIIKVLQTNQTAVSNDDGVFTLNLASGSYSLGIYHLSYMPKKQVIEIPLKEVLIIPMNNKTEQLKEVEVVSTGYQNIPKERATGSFVQVDNQLINRSVSTNILDRLNGVTSGLIFNQNKQNPNSSNITIRGVSTIFANDQPLIILDNFPYQGDLNNINPNDVASITVLKDAAAASIWGVRAGNGVMVITTKKGLFNKPLSVNFNSNVTIIEKPDLYYTPQLSAAQYIEVEKYLFDKGYYWAIGDGFSAISPVLEILQARQNLKISKADSASRMNVLNNNDIRRDMEKYLYRKGINQQYQVNVSGGGINNRFYVSAGYDKNLQQLVTDNYDRITLNANNTFSFLKNKLEWKTGVIFTNSKTSVNDYTYLPASPYEQLADASGNFLPVVKGLRKSYIDTAGAGRLLDWRYIPLNENHPNQISGLNDYRLNTELSYKILRSLKISAYYLYQKGITDNVRTFHADSYYTRNQINTYSQLNTITGAVISPISEGEIVNKDNSNYKMNTGRLQLNFEQILSNNHQISALAGFEASEYTNFGDSYTLYGYNPATAINNNNAINPIQDYQQYYGFSTGRISPNLASSASIDRNRSFYANASYSYKLKYILSASARRDESNIFGVSTNQKGVPLWSAGLAWNINEELFYKLEWMPYLKLRATYGYNGNVDKTATAYLTGRVLGVNSFGAPNLIIVNPPNPSLRWEKVGVTNIGLDFGLKENTISGSIEYYVKNSTDLIANSPTAQQTGLLQFKGNAANMRTKGVDVILNIQSHISKVDWSAKILFNYVKDKVTSYRLNPGTNFNIVSGNYKNPLEGYPLYSIFSFPSAKLDNQGNPQGYLKGKLSEDYASLLSSTDHTNIKYEGSATPVYFGNIINNWHYKKLDFSMGVSYNLDYCFRKPSLNYSNLAAGAYQQADYNRRWQNPGDENTTSVPSMIYYPDSNRDFFYNNSDELIQRADNIRLQDLKLGYTLQNEHKNKLPFKSLQLYVYANNMGIIWRANKFGLDPDSPFLPSMPRSISFGVKAGL